MIQISETKIQACEEELRIAMLNSDVTALDNLLAADLIFTNHLGKIMTKQNDLEAHRTGILSIDKIELSDQRIKIVDNIAIVSVQARIVGHYNNEISDNMFRFTRVWNISSNDNWQVIVAHSTMLS